MCLAQGHNAVTPVRLEPAALRSRVKHSSCIGYVTKYNKYLQYILNNFSEFNGCFIGGRLHRKFCQLSCYFAPISCGIFSDLASTLIGLNILSMDASFYPFLPSEVFFRDMDCQLHVTGFHQLEAAPQA